MKKFGPWQPVNIYINEYVFDKDFEDEQKGLTLETNRYGDLYIIHLCGLREYRNVFESVFGYDSLQRITFKANNIKEAKQIIDNILNKLEKYSSFV